MFCAIYYSPGSTQQQQETVNTGKRFLKQTFVSEMKNVFIDRGKVGT